MAEHFSIPRLFQAETVLLEALFCTFFIHLQSLFVQLFSRFSFGFARQFFFQPFTHWHHVSETLASSKGGSMNGKETLHGQKKKKQNYIETGVGERCFFATSAPNCSLSCVQ